MADIKTPGEGPTYTRATRAGPCLDCRTPNREQMHADSKAAPEVLEVVGHGLAQQISSNSCTSEGQWPSNGLGHGAAQRKDAARHGASNNAAGHAVLAGVVFVQSISCAEHGAQYGSVQGLLANNAKQELGLLEVLARDIRRHPLQG